MHAPSTSLPLTAQVGRPLAPSIERWRLRAYLSLIIADIVCLLAAFLLAGGIYLGEWPAEVAMFEAQLLLPVFLTIANAFSATCFLQGIALEEVGEDWLKPVDHAYPVIVTVRAKKAESGG